MTDLPFRAVRAAHDERSLVVYQAYRVEIAEAALSAGTFVPPFKRERMTWIKPSFRWMMYRSGWASKPGQERVLAVRISRAGFEQALALACPSHHDRRCHASREEWRAELATSPVRVQWDPERSTRLGALEHRALQLGLSGRVVADYVDEWILGITDATALAHEARALVRDGRTDLADALIPAETPYPLPEHLAARIGATA
ncbi:DUF4291 domain-containing protein [Kitasatospora sp. NPDC085879]|uniref:DUF4291 domain-containing protein n=1 Tax=Kitasatospora sp. NPDC085879 TaxID=3154769 RepID=UPI003414E7AD